MHIIQPKQMYWLRSPSIWDFTIILFSLVLTAIRVSSKQTSVLDCVILRSALCRNLRTENERCEIESDIEFQKSRCENELPAVIMSSSHQVL